MQITRLESGRTPTSSAGGWPLMLLNIGAAGLLVSLLPHARSREEPTAEDSS